MGSNDEPMSKTYELDPRLKHWNLTRKSIELIFSHIKVSFEALLLTAADSDLEQLHLLLHTILSDPAVCRS